MRKFLMIIMATLLMVACQSASNVEYSEAQNYFFRNDAKIPSSLKITSKQQFDSYFGMAAVMGKNGQPTEIDFNRQFVIAKVLPVTDVETELKLRTLTEEDNRLVADFQVIRGQKQSWSMQPFLILIVDRKYVDRDVMEKQ